MAKIGRKLNHGFAKIGRKLVHSRGKIGRKLTKAGRIVGRIAPFLSAIPAIGPGLAAAAAGASVAARSVGGGLARSQSTKRSLAETYHAAKRSRR